MTTHMTTTSRICTLIAATGLAFGLAQPAAAQYKYLDEKGVTVYSDQPPPPGARRAEQREFKAQPADADTSGLPYALAQAVRKAPVVLYSQANCSPCDIARKLLTTRGVPFTEHSLPTREDLDAFHRLGFDDFLPAATVGAAKLSNYTPDEWNAALDRAGYPKTSVLPRGWRNPPVTALVATQPAQQPPATVPAPGPEAAPTPAPAPEGTNPPGFRF